MSSLNEDLVSKRERLANYLKREEKMLNDGVQSYGIGSRNVSRYQTDLGNIQSMISKLENEIKQLERKLAGRTSNYSCRVIPSDL